MTKNCWILVFLQQISPEWVETALCGLKIDSPEVLIDLSPEFGQFWKHFNFFFVFSEFCGISYIIFHKILPEKSKIIIKSKLIFSMRVKNGQNLDFPQSELPQHFNAILMR
jgi:hypothetical protein